MTELLLLGKTPQTSKSVDEFMSEIPMAGRKRRRTGRRRLNELSKEHRAVMGRINMLYVKKEFDAAWNLCEELIQKGSGKVSQNLGIDIFSVARSAPLTSAIWRVHFLLGATYDIVFRKLLVNNLPKLLITLVSAPQHDVNRMDRV